MVSKMDFHSSQFELQSKEIKIQYFYWNWNKNVFDEKWPRNFVDEHLFLLNLINNGISLNYV